MASVKSYLKHVSVSTLTRMMSDPRGFYRTKVARLPEKDQKPAMLVGSALHYAAERVLTGQVEPVFFLEQANRYVELCLKHSNAYVRAALASDKLSGDELAAAKEEMARLEAQEPLPLDGGPEKVEDVLDDVAKGATNFLDWMNESPMARSFKYELDVTSANGDLFPGINMNGRIDAVSSEEGEVVDWKFVARFSETNRKYDVQAWFYHYLLEAAGIPTFRCVMREFKKSKPKDGIGHKDYVIDFSDKYSASHKAFLAFCRRSNVLLDADAEILKSFMTGELSMLTSAKPWDGTELEEMSASDAPSAKDDAVEYDLSDL